LLPENSGLKPANDRTAIHTAKAGMFKTGEKLSSILRELKKIGSGLPERLEPIPT